MLVIQYTVNLPVHWVLERPAIRFERKMPQKQRHIIVRTAFCAQKNKITLTIIVWQQDVLPVVRGDRAGQHIPPQTFLFW